MPSPAGAAGRVLAATRSKSNACRGRRREHDRAGLVLERVGPARELDPHPLLEEADLGARVLVVGEAEGEQARRG